MQVVSLCRLPPARAAAKHPRVSSDRPRSNKIWQTPIFEIKDTVMTEHPPEEITIDPALRGFMIRIDALVTEVGVDGLDEAGVEAPGVSADRTDDGRVSFTWKNAGWHWSFRLTAEEIGALAMGERKTVQMRRVMEVLDLSAGAGGLDKLLAGLFEKAAVGESADLDEEFPEDDGDDIDFDDALFQRAQALIETEPPADPVDPSHRRFLDGLIKEEAIEVSEGADLDALAIGMGQFLDGEDGSYRRAQALSEWLLDHDSVEDLFIDDAALAKVLKVW